MTIKVRVYHDFFGCESGCCGHTVELEGDVHFDFSHPYGEEAKAWARSHAEEVIREHHPECLATIDWSSLDWEGVTDS